MGRTTSTTYDAVGRPLTVTYSGSAVIRYEYDGLNQVKAMTDPSGARTTFSYDANGNLETVGAPNGTTQYTYDSMDRVKTRTDPIGFTGGLNLYTYVGGHPTNATDEFGLAEVNLGMGWGARIDQFNNSEGFEIHVFNPQSRMVGVVQGRWGWVARHGFSGQTPANIPESVLNAINGVNVAELRRRGLVGPKGTENINRARYVRPGSRMFSALTGFLQFLSEYAEQVDLARRAAANGVSPGRQLCSESEALGHPTTMSTPFGIVPNPCRLNGRKT